MLFKLTASATEKMLSKLQHCVRTITFTVLILSSVVIIPYSLMFTTFPLLLLTPFYVTPPQFRVQSKVLVLWEAFVTGLLEFVAGIKIKIFGDIINPKDNCLYIMNHRTRLDWLYFWVLLLRMKALTHSRVIMKAELKDVIPTGWAMQMINFLFLQRKWEEDKVILSKTLDYFKDIKRPIQFLIFPEGTNFEDITKKKSDSFAKKNNLPEYKYVLHPRTTGFTHLVQHMRKNNSFDAVYDITIGYTDNIPVEEQHILLGNFPKGVHYNIKRYAASDIPSDTEDVEEWCKTRWHEKETQLEAFYKSKHFQAPLAKCREAQFLSFIALVTEIVIECVWLYLMWWSPLVYWYTIMCGILMIPLYIYARKVHGGIELMVIDIYNRFHRNQDRRNNMTRPKTKSS